MHIWSALGMRLPIENTPKICSRGGRGAGREARDAPRRLRGPMGLAARQTATVGFLASLVPRQRNG